MTKHYQIQYIVTATIEANVDDRYSSELSKVNDYSGSLQHQLDVFLNSKYGEQQINAYNDSTVNVISTWAQNPFVVEVPGRVRRRTSLIRNSVRTFRDFFNRWNDESRCVSFGRYASQETMDTVNKYSYLVVSGEQSGPYSTVRFPEIGEDAAVELWQAFHSDFEYKCETLYNEMSREYILKHLDGVYEDGGIDELRQQNVDNVIRAGNENYNETVNAGRRRSDEQELF